MRELPQLAGFPVTRPRRLRRTAALRRLVADVALSPSDLIGKRAARERTLFDDELRAVWHAAGSMGYPYGAIFRMLILTGQREREVGDMRWSEVDFDKKLWTIPANRM